MDMDEIRLRRLEGQHLLRKSDTPTVVRELCGVQAQFLSHALHGLSIRCHAVSSEGLVKSWTNRGTMHLFSVDDLPLFLHEGRRHTLRPVDTMESDSYLSAQRKAYFADLIVDAVARGIGEREELKALCEKAGMTESESRSLFDPWGGTIRALCEAGRLCHRVQEKKAYQLCPAFEPMEEGPARLELAQRYFTHFGPATVKDAAYFLGWTQKEVRQQLSRLDAAAFSFNDRIYYHIPRALSGTALPPILFLAGFDQLMLGYEKQESLFLPPEHLRQIFTLSGIVRPPLLVNGTVAGHWNLKNRRLSVTTFQPVEEALLREAARLQWADLKSIEFL